MSLDLACNHIVKKGKIRPRSQPRSHLGGYRPFSTGVTHRMGTLHLASQLVNYELTILYDQLPKRSQQCKLTNPLMGSPCNAQLGQKGTSLGEMVAKK